MKQFTAAVFKRDHSYVARCMELGIVSQGESPEEAQEGLREVVELLYRAATKGEIPKDVLNPRKHQEEN